MDIAYIIKDLIHVLRRGGSLQDFVDRRSSVGDVCFLKYVSKVKTIDDFELPREQCNSIIAQVYEEYNYEDIRPTDIVLDVGANVGVFSLKVAPKVKHVYAVEPLFFDRLRENIKRNGLKNVTPLKVALSLQEGTKFKGYIYLEFAGVRGQAIGKSFPQIVSMCGGHIDFLKCDCEGGEWFINPDQIEAAGIRRIEMEVHARKYGLNLEEYPKILKKINFDVKKENRGKTLLLHATKKEKEREIEREKRILSN